MTQRKVLGEIEVEMERQRSLWGEQNHPSIPLPGHDWRGYPSPAQYLGLPSEDEAKRNCNQSFEQGRGTYAHIAVEELAEAIDAPNDILRREELVQLAAVCASWIESIDRRLA